MNHTDLHGQTLQAALQEQRALQLSFYSFDVILRKVTENGGVIEHPVDLQAISRALSDKICFSTESLSDDILYVQQEGVKETIVSYRNLSALASGYRGWTNRFVFPCQI